jgi:hypothetical protein
MRVLKIVAVAAISLIATSAVATAQAADKAASTSPIVGQFPSTANNLQVVLFTLKDNKISLSISAQEFCSKLDYGDAVFWERPDEVKDHTAVPGNLNWVVCKFKGR